MHHSHTLATTFKRLLQMAVFCMTYVSASVQAAGLLTPTDANWKPLEIQSHHVEVTIENGYAITQVEQTFFNPNPQDLDARYSFPIPHKASVSEFKYWIDGKPVVGEVLEKTRAKAVFEREQQHGREAALVSQNGTQTFDIIVTPVRAQQTVRLQITYLQRTDIDTSVGRYVYPLADGGIDTIANTFWSQNDAVQENFSFTLNLRSDYPIDGIRLPKHPQANIVKKDNHQWIITLKQDAKHNPELLSPEQIARASAPATHTRAPSARLDQDIVVYWRLTQGLPASIDLTAHKAPNQPMGTFMLTLTPGDDLRPITEGRDWIFILDYSGSMKRKYSSMIEGIRQGLHKLTGQDRFRLITFNDQSQEVTRGFVAATPEEINYALKRLEKVSPNGGTNLYAGLEAGIKKLATDRSSALMLVTDGQANVGITEKKAFLSLLQQKDVRLFSFVMGNSANKPLLEGMAKVSNGFALRVSNSDDIVGRLLETTSWLTHEAMHDITLDFSGVDVLDVTPRHIGSLYRGQQITVLGRYRQAGPAEATLRAKISGQPITLKTQFSFPNNSSDNPELERLWAFASIDDMLSEMDFLGKSLDTEQAITDLAINYGLVTDYTSMITVREEAFEQYQIERQNKKRVAAETQARQRRQLAPTQSRQVNQQPLSNKTRPSLSGGGGSIELWTVFALLGLLGLLGFRALRKSAQRPY